MNAKHGGDAPAPAHGVASGGGSGAALLVAAARRLFLEQGYANVSMQAIAAEAGMTKGAPYYYFPSKEALFLAVSREVLVTLRDAVNRALAGDAPLRDRLCAALAVVVNSTSDDLSTWLTDLKLVLKPDEAMAMVHELIGSYEIGTIFVPVLAEAQARGEMTRVNPAVAARVMFRLMMACMEECSHWRQGGTPHLWNPREAIAESVDVFLYGIGTPLPADSGTEL
ncbi:MAG TPA: TetR/AcrR family transcriptional regulator [Thermomicrobiales bacterium]|nr:TetR/AcrR family transcriptional regulator [Thermomicrobiales bacterium]